MSRYLAIITATIAAAGRGADSSAAPVLQKTTSEISRRFATEQEALQFKDDVLNRFAELEVIIRPETQSAGGLRYYWDAGHIVSQAVA